MPDPAQWTMHQLAEDAECARERFRVRRLDEPLALYTEFFDAFAPVFDRLIDRIGELAGHERPAEIVADAMRDDETRVAFRYLAAPPISEDDLKTLANARLSPAALRRDPASAQRVRDTVLHILDPKRFPWLAQHRRPGKAERDAAIVASAALVAAQKVQTRRRSDARAAQEEAVKRLLRCIGFTEVDSRDMPLLRDAPAPGEFCAESKLGDARADIVAGLYDRRVLALECKASNSEVNSFKRINHEAAGKARNWLSAFGQRQLVPAAVLSGVFKPENLAAAQTQGLALFWFHRLGDLQDFIAATRA